MSPEPHTNAAITQARHILAAYDGDQPHAENVLALAVTIFNAAQKQHGLNANCLTILQTAALLHDTGISISHKGHHKYSAHIIENSGITELTDVQRRMAAQTARYHRKALPKKSHGGYAALTGTQKAVVKKLAAILRVADALDHTHQGLLRNAKAFIENDALYIKHPNSVYAWGEQESLNRKQNLFNLVFGLTVILVK